MEVINIETPSVHSSLREQHRNTVQLKLETARLKPLRGFLIYASRVQPSLRWSRPDWAGLELKNVQAVGAHARARLGN
jgi:hypothetical protein